MLRLLIITTLISLLPLGTNAQKRSAQKLYNEALTLVKPEESIILLQKAIEKDSTYTEAYLYLARKYEQLQQYNLQVHTLLKASEKCERKSNFVFAQLSHAAYFNGNYMIAANGIDQLETEYDDELKRLKANISFSIGAVSSPHPFEAISLGDNVNTIYHDYWPSLSIDERQIVTTVFVDTKSEQEINTSQEDFYYSKKEESSWGKAKPLSSIINSPNNEGAQSLSIDGKTMLFTTCNRFDGIGACDIYIAYKINGVWSPPTPLPSPLNTTAWEGHPSISADGKKLYFSSNRKGGYGGRDLYVASIELSPSIIIGEITNLGPKINTEKHEISPYMHPDGVTLYFSSDGHLGLGRQDLFYSHKDSTGFFETPINFGYPINTHHDEIGLVVNAQGNRGYFSAERDDSKKKDIYSFNMPSKTQANKVTYLKANIKDITAAKELKADVEVSNICTGEIIYEAKNISDFTIALHFDEDYAINVSRPNYLFYSDNIALDTKSKTPFEKEISLSQISKGQRIVLENVLFQLNSYSLDTTFTAELDKVVKLIKRNPKFQFEISGHTDNQGTSEYNLILSEQRAKVIYDYLTTQGVESNKLSYKGYGQSCPISDLDKENRRTELLVK